MDEHAYRQQLAAILHPCPFEKSLLSRCVACTQVNTRQIAEREVLCCNSPSSWSACMDLRDAFRKNFTFALGKSHIEGPMPHAQEMRMQCGGLKGLQFILKIAAAENDVSALISFAGRHYGGLENLPFMQIVQASKTCYDYRSGLK